MNQEKDIQVSVKEAYGNAVSLLESGNYELAEKQLAEILQNYPNDPNALRLSGISSIEQGKPEIALIPLKKALDLTASLDFQSHGIRYLKAVILILDLCPKLLEASS